MPADVVKSSVKFAARCVKNDPSAVPVVVTLFASDCPGDVGPVEVPGKLSVTQQELLGEQGSLTGQQECAKEID